MNVDDEYWLRKHTADISLVPLDFGISKIAEYFGKCEALAQYWEGASKENQGDIDGAIELYKRAFRSWPSLDSITDGGLPRGIREDALKAGTLNFITLNTDRPCKRNKPT